MLPQVGIILLTLMTAAWHDLKKKTVSSYVLFPILLLGLLNVLLFMATYPHPLFRYSTLILACGWVVVGIVLHQLKLLGGADIMLIAGIILITPAEFLSFEYFMFFGLFTCLAGLVYYAIMWAAKKQDIYIKFVPCILVGWVVTVIGLFWREILAAIL